MFDCLLSAHAAEPAGKAWDVVGQERGGRGREGEREGERERKGWEEVGRGKEGGREGGGKEGGREKGESEGEGGREGSGMICCSQFGMATQWWL